MGNRTSTVYDRLGQLTADGAAGRDGDHDELLVAGCGFAYFPLARDLGPRQWNVAAISDNCRYLAVTDALENTVQILRMHDRKTVTRFTLPGDHPALRLRWTSDDRLVVSGEIDYETRADTVWVVSPGMSPVAMAGGAQAVPLPGPGRSRAISTTNSTD